MSMDPLEELAKAVEQPPRSKPLSYETPRSAPPIPYRLPPIDHLSFTELFTYGFWFGMGFAIATTIAYFVGAIAIFMLMAVAARIGIKLTTGL